MPVSAAELNALEVLLKRCIYGKSKEGANEELVLQKAFKQFDADGSGEVSYSEFVRAMERFGLVVTSEILPGRASGGVREEVMRGLFDRYNTDGSEAISYSEFAAGLYQGAADASGGGGGVGGSGERPGSSSKHTRGLSLDNPKWREGMWPTTPADHGAQANPWLPSLVGQTSMDDGYRPPNPSNPHVRVRSIANPNQTRPYKPRGPASLA